MRRDAIREVKEDTHKHNLVLRAVEKKRRKADKQVKEKHEAVIEIQERVRSMNEVLRLKKLEDKKNGEPSLSKEKELSLYKASADAGQNLYSPKLGTTPKIKLV